MMVVLDTPNKGIYDMSTDQQPNPKNEREPYTRKGNDTSATKPRRKRKTSTEQMANANKPIDPKLWFLLGGLIMIPTICIYLDPVSFASAGQSQSSGMWIRDLLVMVVALLGRNPTVILLTALAAISFGWGLREWLKQGSEKH
jgi:hypothetical protein